MADRQPQRSNDSLVRIALPWLAYAVVILQSVAGTYLGWVNRLTPEVPPSFGARPSHLVAALAAGTVGVFLVARARQNVIGWLLLALGLLGGSNIAFDTYAGYALYTHPGLPGGLAAAWVFNWLWVPLVAVVAICFPLLFPDGRLLNDMWRRVLIGGALAAAVATTAAALRPGPLDPFDTIQNPLGLNWAPVDLMEAALLPVPVVAAVAVASQFVRYRRASNEQRHQIKWVALAAAFITFLFAVVTVVELRTDAPDFPHWLATSFVLSMSALPLATAVAIFRYRLYDIDIILNRTLVYVPLTAGLAGLYVSMSGLLRTLLTNVTDAGSDAAIAMSTLMIVAILTPAKNKLQTIVDRRFKEAPDPQKALRGLTEQARSFADLADRRVLLPRYLEALTTAFNSSGASVELAGAATSPMRLEQGAVVGAPALQSEMRAGTTSLGMLHLYPRNDGRSYTLAEEETLHSSVESISRVMGLVRPTE